MSFLAHLWWQITPDAEHIDLPERASDQKVLGGVQLAGDHFVDPGKLPFRSSRGPPP